MARAHTFGAARTVGVEGAGKVDGPGLLLAGLVSAVADPHVTSMGLDAIGAALPRVLQLAGAGGGARREVDIGCGSGLSTHTLLIGAIVGAILELKAVLSGGDLIGAGLVGEEISPILVPAVATAGASTTSLIAGTGDAAGTVVADGLNRRGAGSKWLELAAGAVLVSGIAEVFLSGLSRCGPTFGGTLFTGPLGAASSALALGFTGGKWGAFGPISAVIGAVRTIRLFFHGDGHLGAIIFEAKFVGALFGVAAAGLTANAAGLGVGDDDVDHFCAIIAKVELKSAVAGTLCSLTLGIEGGADLIAGLVITANTLGVGGTKWGLPSTTSAGEGDRISATIVAGVGSTFIAHIGAEICFCDGIADVFFDVLLDVRNRIGLVGVDITGVEIIADGPETILAGLGALNLALLLATNLGEFR